MIASPCNKTCIIDPASRLCVGCGRNLIEIERWMRLTDQERAQVIGELPRRLALLAPRQVAVAKR
jgi:predicted Fe-S protein YdhL (DUF1289 family)